MEWVKEHPWETVTGIVGVAAGSIVGGHHIYKKYKNRNAALNSYTGSSCGGRQTRNAFIDDWREDRSRYQIRQQSNTYSAPVNRHNTEEFIRQLSQQASIVQETNNPVQNPGSFVPVGLKDYSILKANGYNTSLSQEKRQKIIDDVVNEYGTRKTAQVLQYLINTRSANKKGLYDNKAIPAWKEDLDYIKGMDKK